MPSCVQLRKLASIMHEYSAQMLSTDHQPHLLEVLSEDLVRGRRVAVLPDVVVGGRQLVVLLGLLRGGLDIRALEVGRVERRLLVGRLDQLRVPGSGSSVAEQLCRLVQNLCGFGSRGCPPLGRGYTSRESQQTRSHRSG